MRRSLAFALASTGLALSLTVALARAEDQPKVEPADTSSEDAAVETALRAACARASSSIVEVETLGALPEKIEAPKPGEEPEGGGGSVEGVLAKAGFKQAAGPSTGVAIAKDLVVTSTFPFQEKPRHVFVTRSDGRSFVAQLLGRDEARMIQLLRVEGGELTPAKAAPRESWKVGRFAAALGRGLGTGKPSLSLGIVSAIDRIGGRAIQTSASVSPACYGGPLVTIEGDVLGVLVPITAFGGMAGVDLYDSGIGFAIPLTDLAELLPRLVKGDVLKPAFLGIGIDQGRTEDGVLIDTVQEGSGADKAFIRKGDIIVEIDGKPVQAFFQLHQALGRKSAGDKIQLTIVHRKKRKTVEVVLGEPPPPEAAGPHMPRMPGQDPHGPGPKPPKPEKPDEDKE